jgi:hypothetical protein
VWHAAWRYYRDRFRLALAGGGDERCYRAFLRVWQSAGNYAATAEQVGGGAGRPFSATRPAVLQGAVYHPGESAQGQEAGFHAAETWRGRSFRWTEPAACLAIDLPGTDTIVTFDTQGLRCPSSDEVRLYFNGVPASPEPARCGPGRLAFRVSADAFRASGPQRLALTSSRAAGRRDTRRLALPLFAIEFAAAYSLPAAA